MEYFIVSAYGGAYEESWDFSFVVIGKENANKLFDHYVEKANTADDDYMDSIPDEITLDSAHVDKDGVIRSNREFLRIWREGKMV